MSKKNRRNNANGQRRVPSAFQNASAAPPFPNVGHASLFPSISRNILAYFTLLALITFSVYFRTLRNPFVNFDDPNYVTENHIVQQGLTKDTARWAITTTTEANWHPLTWLSHELDCQLFGLRPAGHHLMSVVLHLLNVTLLFLLLMRLTGEAGPSLLVSALFALHPINVESVAWVAERKNVLSMFFFLLTLIAYTWYVRKPSVLRYLVMAILFVLGLTAKPMIVSLPFVLFLMDIWPLRRVAEWPSSSPSLLPATQAPAWRLALEKLPLLLLSAASCVITMAVQRKAMESVPFSVRIANAVDSYVVYLEKALFSIHLAAFYPYQGFRLPVWHVFLCLLILVAITAWTVRYRSNRYLLVGWLWFLGTLVPMIGLVQVGEQGMADRYAYLPLVGLFVMIAWGTTELVERTKLDRRMWAFCLILVLTGLAALTGKQIGTWHSNDELWSHALQVTTDNYMAEEYVGEALMETQFKATGQRYSQQAEQHLRNAVRINPADPTCRVNLGAVLQERGDLRAAVAQYLSVFQLTKDPYLNVKALIDLGAAYHQMGEYDKARQAYLQAMRLDPTNQAIFINLGKLAMVERIKALSSSATAHPSPQAYMQLAEAQQAADEITEARTSYQIALKLNPNLPGAQDALDKLRNEAGR